MSYFNHIAKALDEMDKRNKEVLRATSLFSQRSFALQTISLPRVKLESLIAQGRAIEKLVTNTRVDIPKVVKAAPSIGRVFPSLPKINIKLPKITIDYERIEKITNHNSRHGWTLTGEIQIDFYLNDYFLTLGQNDLDNIFVSYYETNDYEQLKRLVKVLLEGLSEKWKELIEDTFKLYLEGKFRISIPVLITIIEGEISELTESVKVGMRLMGEFKDKIDENDKYLAIASYSILNYFEEKLFKTHPFDEERKSMINRNWILHGRDNPEHWGKADALRLLNTLATIQFIKTMKWEAEELGKV
ncbi:hypothetical protein FTE28_17690 [Bacillus licheniformis]|uniref:hypothetical protein n=1 Tax=Bacillus licheniformis TaxID=1402 RepID=UPI0005CEB051|nr:hypothetical protein [Bacillus licheniformis]MCA1182078.1 hypothetical protein [Bacillus licheniformis]MCY7740557.1 hypothetical protein [Bacillus licheniformis]MED1024587.1 hypothetical protein [Bacillus licheniformis]MED1033061.1 hypothetical protein [Bacillus licheniformis]MED1102379.1 hypothetical protein [Bacillus licheniformis]